ncbi:helix-turn-helix transcriptional regulator [Conexibacter sp. JD483]|uniref:helix-turn-helix domain-containing protein n=1 Tax=unclassified Conexibacter TaxID=2627773 RepID=UPI002721DF62|nr:MULTISPECIES: helix-turn-helix transcriptional regulator [unclassified Conexibacter]MDO8188460.1 helix-turn-helix transcriptional regulator [Conexibacter sp. CPCC 205706]MDO8199179.1 helix-turn-helix transcriptional regulator [Conexibacter sp. CPCC 205762]MDR9371930.1 helix-turn-helix transcriptional regulator [Conexibacter sp. JD483]
MAAATLTDDAVLRQLGERVERQRLDRNLTQQVLSERAGVARTVVQRLERGDPIATTGLVRILRALDLLAALDAAFPEPLPSPVEAAARGGRRRRRARASSRDTTDQGGWRWGDEQ